MKTKTNNPWEEIKTPLSNYNVRRADADHIYEFFWAEILQVITYSFFSVMPE